MLFFYELSVMLYNQNPRFCIKSKCSFINPYFYITNYFQYLPVITRLGNGVPDSLEFPELSTIGVTPHRTPTFFFSRSPRVFNKNIFLPIVKNIKKDIKLLLLEHTLDKNGSNGPAFLWQLFCLIHFGHQNRLKIHIRGYKWVNN